MRILLVAAPFTLELAMLCGGLFLRWVGRPFRYSKVMWMGRGGATQRASQCIRMCRMVGKLCGCILYTRPFWAEIDARVDGETDLGMRGTWMARIRAIIPFCTVCRIRSGED